MLEKMEKSVSVLEEWYLLDENNIPALYVLRPVVEMAKVDEMTDEEIRAAKSKWWKAEDQIVELLSLAVCQASEEGLMDVEQARKYLISVTEHEIQRGLIEAPPKSRKFSCAIFRNIDDITEHLDSEMAEKFMDIKKVQTIEGEIRNAVDESFHEMICSLKDTVIPKYLDIHNQIHFNVMWKDGIDASFHKEYLQQFCDQFYKNCKNLIDGNVRENSMFSNDELYVEVLQHSAACVSYVKKFQGRQEIMESIKSYILGSSTYPLIIYGASGSGKTSVLAKAASMTRDWLPEDRQESAILLLRFLGTSPGTSSIRQTLKYLCRQLATFGNDSDQAQASSIEEFKELVDTFYSMLKRFSEFRPIVIFLDSVDQLDSTDGAYHLTWMRSRIPENVKLVVSTLPDMYNLLPTFRSKFSKSECFVEVTPLEEHLCEDIMKALLAERGRQLNNEQWNIVREAFRKCSLPIYVDLIFHQVYHWKSFAESGLIIESSVRGAIFQLFKNLEVKHGKVFTSHALAYVTASRNGLSESELEDLLSLDDEVLRDVFQYHLPPAIRIPPFCWTRLRQDIGNYITEREADSTRVIYWYHRQFIEVAKDYFLSDVKFRQKIHSNMADYFLGTWGAGRRKPFQYPPYLVKKLKLPKYSKEDRIVPSQPYILENREMEDGSLYIRYNLRKLNELPLHLIRANRLEEFYDYLVFDYEFLFNKLCGTSRYLLLRDLDLASSEGVTTIKELEYVYNAIRLAAQSLVSDPINLSVDLIGRLINFEKDHPRIKLLLDQCRVQGLNFCTLVPTVQCFDSGSGMLYSSFDLGLGMGVVMPNGQMVSFSLIANEISWWDIEGNEIKTFPVAYNFFLSLKYLLNAVQDDCSAVALVAQPKGAKQGLDLSLELGSEERVEMKKQILAKYVKEIENLESQDDEVPAKYKKWVDKLTSDLTNEDEDEDLGEELEAELQKLVDVFNKKRKNPLELLSDDDDDEDGDDGDDGDARKQDFVKVYFDSGRIEKLHTISSEVKKKFKDDEIEMVTEKWMASNFNKNSSNYSKSGALLYNISKREVAFEDNSVYIGTVILTVDDKYFVCFKTGDKKLLIRNLETGEDKEIDYNERSDEAGDSAQVISVIYLQGLFVVFFNGSAGEREIHLIDTSAASHSELKIDHTEVLPGQGRLKGVQSFFSESKNMGCFLFTKAISTKVSIKSHQYRGVIWNRDAKKAIELALTEETMHAAKLMNNFGDGCQGKFAANDELLITSGQKCLMLVWSCDDGSLLHEVRIGEAEAFISGQPKNSDFFVLCHFPDESGAGEDEKMFIMAKVFNLKTLKIGNKENETEVLPTYKSHKQSSYVVSSLVDSDVIVVMSSEKLSIDTKKGVVAPGTVEDHLVKDFVIGEHKYRYNVELDNYTPNANLSSFEGTFGYSEKQEIPVALEEECDGDWHAVDTFMLSFVPLDVTSGFHYHKTRLNNLSKGRGGSDRFGFHLEDGKFLLCLNVPFTHKGKSDLIVYDLEERKRKRKKIIQDNIRFEDLTEEEKSAYTEVKDDETVSKPDLSEMTLTKFSLRPGHPTQYLLFYNQVEKLTEIARRDAIVFWSASVTVGDWTDWSLKSGPVLDAGGHVEFLKDGDHLLNYKLEIYNFLTGEMIRKVAIQGDFFAHMFQLTADEKFAFVQEYTPSYKVDFMIFDDDSSLNTEEMWAIEPPRIVQIYRMSDGQRLANYNLEMDPEGFVLAGADKRTVVLLTHNDKPRILRIHDHPDDVVVLHEDAQNSQITQDGAANQPAQPVFKPLPGPKEAYLRELGPILARGMAQLADKRPSDPIDYLAKWLKQEQASLDQAEAESEGK